MKLVILSKQETPSRASKGQLLTMYRLGVVPTSNAPDDSKDPLDLPPTVILTMDGSSLNRGVGETIEFT